MNAVVFDCARCGGNHHTSDHEDVVHACSCCGEDCPDGVDCCSDEFPEPGDVRETGR